MDFETSVKHRNDDQIDPDYVPQLRREYLHNILLGAMTAAGLLEIAMLISVFTQITPFPLLALVPFTLIFAGSFVAFRMLQQRDHLDLAVYIFILGLLLGTSFLMLYGRTYTPLLRQVAPFMLTLVAAVAGILLALDRALITMGISTLWLLASSLLMSRTGLLGILTYDWIAVLLSWFITGVTAVTSGSLYSMANHSTQSYLAAQRRADEFFENKEQLRKALAAQDWLNQKLKTTNRALETSTEVGRQATSILKTDELLTQVATLIQENFNIYFVGIWLPDATQRALLLHAGALQGQPATAWRELQIPLDATSIVADVYRHGVHRRAADVYQEPDYLVLEPLAQTRSVLALPLRFGNTTLGVLDIENVEINAFDEDALAVMQALANQISVAMRNAQLYRAEQARRQLAESLEQTGRALSGSLDLREVPQRILEQLAVVVPYVRGAVLLHESSELRSVALSGYPEPMTSTGYTIAIREGDLFQQIVDSHEPLLIADTTADPRFQQLPELEVHHSYLGAPLISKDRVVGIVSLTRPDVNAFTPADAQLVMAFTGQAAIALENAGLVNEIRIFNEQLEQMVAERTEALNRAYKTLEKMDKNKTAFIEIAAHELRTPLTVIKGYTQVLKNTVGGERNPAAQEMLSGILIGTQRLHTIVNSMLEIAKIDNAALNMAREPVNLNTLFANLTQNLAPVLQERQITLDTYTLVTLPLLQGDPTLLQRAFDELLSNALKYTPDGGRIAVSGVKITDDNYPLVQITVQDTGIGIDPEYHEIIFEKFYQIGAVSSHSSGRTKFKGGGPGLGLAIAKGIFEAHGGSIHVQSPGYNEQTCPGSTFYIILPLRA